MVETHTYFTELPLELVRTGAGELGPPPLPGAGATVLAGIWPAHRNHCKHREWVQEGPLGGVAATSELMRRCWRHFSCVPDPHPSSWAPDATLLWPWGKKGRTQTAGPCAEGMLMSLSPQSFCQELPCTRRSPDAQLCLPALSHLAPQHPPQGLAALREKWSVGLAGMWTASSFLLPLPGPQEWGGHLRVPNASPAASQVPACSQVINP